MTESQPPFPAPSADALKPLVSELTAPAEASPSESLGNFVWEILQTLILAGVLIVIFRAFVFQNYIVEGNSMYPTLLPQERLIVGRINYIVGEPQRGDVIVFQFPQDPTRDFVKRIVGLPGETVSIKNGQVSIDGLPLPAETYIENQSDSYSGPVTLTDDEYYVMGDNRSGSSDSRSWGPLQRRHIIGKAWMVYFPFNEVGLLVHADLEPDK